MSEYDAMMPSMRGIEDLTPEMCYVLIRCYSDHTESDTFAAYAGLNRSEGRHCYDVLSSAFGGRL